MIIFNKCGTAKITVSKSGNRIVPQFSPTNLYAEFIDYTKTSDKKISPIWIVECEHYKDYDFEETDNGMCLSISTDCDHTGDIIKVTLIDEEKNYVHDSVELKVSPAF